MPPSPERIPFTVDARLLEELGERLVGRPAVALAELIKNAYDADAQQVELRFGEDEIEVSDDGHGMTRDEFVEFWMNVGSTHKQQEIYSRKLRRPLTGSKGVGRLAVQFLGKELELRSRSNKRGAATIQANVDWQRAAQSGKLTKAKVLLRTGDEINRRFAGDRSRGTSVIIRGLNQEWDLNAIEDLAKEVWTLRPPLGKGRTKEESFDIRFTSIDPDQETAFEAFLNVLLGLRHSTIDGKLEPTAQKDGLAKLQVSVRMEDSKPVRKTFTVKDRGLVSLSFKILVFHLKHRQPYGIKVADARAHLSRFGGVGIYDGGFRLPYYGVDTDWLRLEQDHSHRISQSKLLPEDMHETGAMTFLPTNTRVLGMVMVDTALERRKARKGGSRAQPLTIAITRDRLVEGAAFKQLFESVRMGIDFYALIESQRQREHASKRAAKAGTPAKGLKDLEEVAKRVSVELSDDAAKELKAAVARSKESTAAAEALQRSQTGFLGALASAGMTALAFQHEMEKVVGVLDDITRRLERLAKKPEPARINDIVDELRSWTQRATATRRMFGALLDEGGRERVVKLKIRRFVDELVRQLRPLLGPVEVDTSSIPSEARLPAGTSAEWTAVFQNVLLNAANAMTDDRGTTIQLSLIEHGADVTLLIEDTGIGVDLATADELFDPFVRRLELSAERRALGAGGTGLGLAIVRAIASTRDCAVRFVEPSDGFATAFSISWRPE